MRIRNREAFTYVPPTLLNKDWPVKVFTLGDAADLTTQLCPRINMATARQPLFSGECGATSSAAVAADPTTQRRVFLRCKRDMLSRTGCSRGKGPVLISDRRRPSASRAPSRRSRWGNLGSLLPGSGEGGSGVPRAKGGAEQQHDHLHSERGVSTFALSALSHAWCRAGPSRAHPASCCYLAVV